jgi:hypothetical protein
MRQRIFFGNILDNWKTMIGTATLAAGLVLFAAAPGAKADDCQERLVHADHKLHEAIEHHGYESKQAAHARHELREARQYCWEHGHRWWDVEGNRWHTERDWDDHDHDHR